LLVQAQKTPTIGKREKTGITFADGKERGREGKGMLFFGDRGREMQAAKTGRSPKKKKGRRRVFFLARAEKRKKENPA